MPKKRRRLRSSSFILPVLASFDNLDLEFSTSSSIFAMQRDAVYFEAKIAVEVRPLFEIIHASEVAKETITMVG